MPVPAEPSSQDIALLSHYFHLYGTPQAEFYRTAIEAKQSIEAEQLSPHDSSNNKAQLPFSMYDEINTLFPEWMMKRADIPFPTPKEATFTFIDLFAGIGGIRLGFEDAGGRCVFSSEWDIAAARTYEANFGERPFGDITQISSEQIPDFDILLAGFPCQAFSIIGKQEGFANETCGTLFFEIERILKAKRPRAFMLENVRNLVAHDKGRTFRIIKEHLRSLGYTIYAKVLNALDYGVPQRRERIIIVGFRDPIPFDFPPPISTSQRAQLQDILEDNVAEKYYVSLSIRQSRLARIKEVSYPKPYISHENMAGSITPRPYSAALRAGASANYILINDERRPTEREMLRLQGFPDTYRYISSYTQVKHQCGNSVAVPVIKAVAHAMVKAIQDHSHSSFR